MANKSVLRIGAFWGFLLAISMPAQAAEKPPEIANLPSSRAITSSSILTNRLSRKQLSLWQSLMTTAQATDEDGIALYPKLRSLWQAATSGGHIICIELPEKREGSYSYFFTAAEFIRPRTDPDGHIQPAVIRLHRHTIDRAVSDPWDDGFQPFKGLGRDERYLEALGHELAHAAAAFHDPDYAQKVHDVEREVDDFLEFWRKHWKMPESAEEMRRRADRIRMLKKELEAPACAAEVEVWRELSLNRSVRARLRRASTPVPASPRANPLPSNERPAQALPFLRPLTGTGNRKQR